MSIPATPAQSNTLRRVIPDPDFQPMAAVVTRPGRAGQPWLLLGLPSGIVVITNVTAAPCAVPLHRFATERQAQIAGRLIEQHSSLWIDGETRFVPEARDADDGDRAIEALVCWARALEAELERRLSRSGAGHYSTLDRLVRSGRIAA